ncbi:hypothetical protein I79_001793 [Cricetulus griseus]|uniref:Uncharacterized protein n=1 Tax=Cricetulus griseus TaxID=10029 RepID=G3GVP6_CRIGR|nr:hypothetical protein I79_001793 [Cricetulus griseus]
MLTTEALVLVCLLGIKWPYKGIKYILKITFEIKFHYAAQAGHIYDLLPQLPKKVDYKHVPQVAKNLPQMLFSVDFTSTIQIKFHIANQLELGEANSYLQT